MGLVDLKQIQIAFFSANKEVTEPVVLACKTQGYKYLFPCTNIPELINILKTKKINAVVFDPKLGGTDVNEFVPALKKSFPKAHLITITGDQELKNQCSELGVPFSLSVPLNTKSLISILQNIAMEALGIKASQMAVEYDEY